MKTITLATLLFFFLAPLFAAPSPSPASSPDRDPEPSSHIEKDRYSFITISLPFPSSDYASTLQAVFFLFGAFCALWAQNTGRNAWLWFFLGVFFSFITVLVLLVKNRNYITREQSRRALLDIKKAEQGAAANP